MPVVYWLINAQDSLQNALEKAARRNEEGAPPPTEPPQPPIDQAEAEKILQQCFPDAEAIIVLHRIGGYRENASKHVFRVEVHRRTETWARIVKVTHPTGILKEWNAWESCLRPSNERGRTFMRITKANGDCAVIYEDAVQTLRAANVVSLEQAVFDCCRWGVPSPSSILMVLDQLFAEHIDRFYSRSRRIDRRNGCWDEFLDGLGKGVAKWKDRSSVPGGCRNYVRCNLPPNARPFIDLLSFRSRLAKDSPTLPEALIGPAHGDLHGRNILIGMVDGEARWGATFDFEDMSPKQFIAWDFVKLECELKIRALHRIYPQGTTDFVTKVFEFEEQLMRKTEQYNHRSFDDWPFFGADETPQDRLWTLMLGIRRQGKKCLELIAGRTRRWLHEYYFFLASYALYSAKFETYSSRDCQVAYLAGSLAATRYLWATTRIQFSPSDAREQARRNIVTATLYEPLIEPPMSGFENALAFASEYIGTKNQPELNIAVRDLERLLQKYPSVSEIVEKLALAYLELYGLTLREEYRIRADRVIRRFRSEQEALYETDIEIMARLGRMWKEQGDRLLDEAGSLSSPERELKEAAAEKLYEEARTCYRRAYDASHDYYPGINVATLTYLLGDTEAAQKIASEILTRLPVWSPQDGSEDKFWVLATRAEAELLLGNVSNAEGYYRQLDAHQAKDPRKLDAVNKQKQRILRKRGKNAGNERPSASQG